MGTLLGKSSKCKYIQVTCMVLGLLIILLIMIWTRAFYGSMQAYQKGRNYLDQHQYIRAITFFDRSIHWYTPFNPYVQRSAERLWEIGGHAEHQRDFKLALIAYRTIRRGFYAASSFYTPGKNWIHKCDIKIAELMQLEQAGKKKPDMPPLPDRSISENQKVKSPDTLWSVLVEIGFFGWIGSVIGFILCVLGRKGDPKYSYFQPVIWTGLTFIFFSLWILSMMNA